MGRKERSRARACYRVEVQGFQTTCGSNKAQEVMVVSGMLKSKRPREAEKEQGKLLYDQSEDGGHDD